MKKVRDFLKNKNVWSVLNCLALTVTVLNVQQCCYWFMHQPEVPEEADRFRTFK